MAAVAEVAAARPTGANVREAKMKELATRARPTMALPRRERAKGAELTAELAQLKRERDGYTPRGRPRRAARPRA